MNENDRYYDPDSMPCPFGCMGTYTELKKAGRQKSNNLNNEKGSEWRRIPTLYKWVFNPCGSASTV